MLYHSFLSPIDNYSNLPFRMLCQRYGAGAACVPLVNSTAIARDARKASMVDAHPDEKNIGVQVVGNDPEALAKSCAVIVEKFPFISWLNINCGCPSMRTMKSGGGSAFLAYPEKMAESVERIRKITDKPVSVKIRIKGNLADTAAVCRQLENAGVDFLIIHGRTAEQGYSGKADWEFIKALKQQLNVPLVGNGDLISREQAKTLVAQGYCDSFMIARAAMANPKAFSNEAMPGFEEKYAMLEEYAVLSEKYLGKVDLKDIRIKAVHFITGAPNAAALRNMLCRATSVEEILNMKEKLFSSQPSAMPTV
jgi:nifR3 family TIM-barrel protein